MTTTIQSTRSQIADIKAKMKTEADPEKLKRLAIWGEELNRLLHELLGEDQEVSRYCRLCGEEKEIGQFTFVQVVYKSKSGKPMIKRARRRTCVTCYHKQVVAAKKRKEFTDYLKSKKTE